MVFMKAAGKWGGILVLVALLITLLKQLIALIGLVTAAFKILVVLVFIALILSVGFVMLRAWNETQRRKRE